MTAADDKKAAEAKAAEEKAAQDKANADKAPTFDAAAKEQEGQKNDTESTVPKADNVGETPEGKIVDDTLDTEKEPAINVDFASDKYDVVFDGRSVRVVDSDDKGVVNWFGSRINLRDLLSGIAQNQK